MSTSPSNRYPYQHPDPKTDNGFRLLFNQGEDLNQAIVILSQKIAALTGEVTTINRTITTETTTTPGTTPSASFPVNVTERIADYTLQQTDAAGLNYFTGTGPYDLELNTGVVRPFFTAVLNLSSDDITATPTAGSGSLVNNLSSVVIPPTLWAVFFFDGVNWWVLDLQIWPQTTTPVSGEFLDTYDATTGQFTQATPGGGGGVTFADNEIVAGSGTAFTLANTPSPPGSLQLFQFLLGFGSVLLREGSEYTLTGASITTVNSLSTGDLRAWYRY